MTSWTKEPPKEHGYYWFRYPNGRGGPWLVCLSHIAHLREWWWHGNDAQMDDEEMRRGGGEWWPIPIQPPTEETP